MILKYASENDIDLFYKLRNSSISRSYAKHKSKIKYKDHKDWYLLNYKKKNNFFFVIIFKNKKSGYLRIEKKNNFYDISICVVKKYRNMSLGTKALSAINKKVNRKMILRAKVNYKNISSIILFLKS